MSWLFELIGGFFASMIQRWLQRSADEQTGKEKQAIEDIQASHDEDKDARAIENADERLSDDELDKRLRNP